jgi:hypothetical protein
MVSIHHGKVTSCVGLAWEHTDGADDTPSASSPPERSSKSVPLSGTAPTPDPLMSPPVGGHPSDDLDTSIPLHIPGHPADAEMRARCLNIERSPHHSDHKKRGVRMMGSGGCRPLACARARGVPRLPALLRPADAVPQ